jgi:hypothetical protein
VPSLSHQLPVAEVVAVTAAVVDVVLMAVDVVEVTTAVDVVVVVTTGCVVVEAVVVDELQDANMSEATIRKETNNQIIPLFTYSSFLFGST